MCFFIYKDTNGHGHFKYMKIHNIKHNNVIIVALQYIICILTI